MRARRLALAVAILAALALASCSGGAPPEAATPEATSPPEAATPPKAATPAPTSTPAPAAVATPEAASAPALAATPTTEATLTPEQACANGVAVAEPEANPGLVADCEMLLRARDALRGDASLDWGGGLAVADWEGVAVSGEPPRVTGLDLRGKGLTGSIPRELRRLRLGEVRLAGNALTGCVPSAFEDASGDAASLGLPWCLRYDRLDATAEVASAGEWAILGGNGEVLATWEQLRSEAAALRVHQTDAGGTSWASEFGAVAVNDLFEWRKTDDCWVRYRVTGAPAAPSGASGRWEFPVEWMTYAATGAGCTGAVGTSTVLRVDEEPAPARAPLVSPVRHVQWLLYPPDWAGELDAPQYHNDGRVMGAASSDIAVVRQHPFWRDPELPTGWTLHSAGIGTEGIDGYQATYLDARGGFGVYLSVSRPWRWPYHIVAREITEPWHNIWETRVIDGHPALVYYSPAGNRTHGTKARIYNRESGILYLVDGISFRINGSPDAVIEIARSLYRP